MLTASGLSQYDITTCAKHGATWRGYLAFHPRARDIIGNGVHRLEVHSSGPQHVDLVVRTVDGTDVRLEGGSWLPENGHPPTHLLVVQPLPWRKATTTGSLGAA